MRSNYKHKSTGKIAEYDQIMGLWYVKGEEKIPIGFWQLEYSNDWEEIHDGNTYTIGEIKEAFKKLNQYYCPDVFVNDFIEKLKQVKNG